MSLSKLLVSELLWRVGGVPVFHAKGESWYGRTGGRAWRVDVTVRLESYCIDALGLVQFFAVMMRGPRGAAMVIPR